MSMHSKRLLVICGSIIGVFVLVLVGTLVYGEFFHQFTGVCVQVIQPACFLGSPICLDFGTPCAVPPLWVAQ